MTQWIITLLAVFGAIGSIVTFIWSQAKYQEARRGVDEALNVRIGALDSKLEDIKKIIGNGGYTGIRQNLQDLKVKCAGDMSDLRVRLSAQQHEIDEIKEK